MVCTYLKEFYKKLTLGMLMYKKVDVGTTGTTSTSTTCVITATTTSTSSKYW